MRKLLLLLALTCSAQAPPRTPADLWNDFALDANEWAKIAGSHDPKIMDAHEYVLWQRMKKEWELAKKAIDPYYQ